MIKAFCCFYNEASLVPYFLSHYQYVDAIHAIVDTASVDATRALLAADPKVTIEDVTMPNGFDDQIKVAWLNNAISRHDPDHQWFFVLDADEFIYPPGDPTGATARDYLASVGDGVLALEAYRMDIFRHAEDADLDPAVTPVVYQRRHGIENSPNSKPIVLRANRGLRLTVGQHSIHGGPPICNTHHFEGAHWQNADPIFSIERRVRDRKERMSQANLNGRLGWHHFTKTREDVAAELAAHSHDPLVL